MYFTLPQILTDGNRLFSLLMASKPVCPLKEVLLSGDHTEHCVPLEKSKAGEKWSLILDFLRCFFSSAAHICQWRHCDLQL